MSSTYFRFDEEFARAGDELGGGDRVVPTAIAVAVCAVLPVSGVSMSVANGDNRLPLGASDSTAAIAESLQFTAGDGPCLQAIRAGTMIDAPSPLFAHRWAPLFDLYRQRTPYRSVASLPLLAAGTVHGALNLFFDHDQGGQHLNLLDAQLVTARSAVLLSDWLERNQSELQDAFDTASSELRSRTWIAVGLLMQSAAMTGLDALATLRARAYSNNTTVDELAGSLVDGAVLVEDVLN